MFHSVPGVPCVKMERIAGVKVIIWGILHDRFTQLLTRKKKPHS